MYIRSGLVAAGFLSAAILASASGVRATTLQPLTLEEMADTSVLIFTGSMAHSEVVLSRDGLFPFTFVTFTVDNLFKGSVQNNELTLRFHGGKTSTGEVVVEGAPEFEKGERYLLFVRDNGVSGFPVTGWSQGQYRFERHPKSGREILVDEEGWALLGIGKGQWLRAALPSSDDRGPAAVLLSEEGVKISESTPDAPKLLTAASETVDPSRVLSDLRSFLLTRPGKKSFAPGRLVESARTDEVPEKVGGASVPSPVQ